MRNLSGAKETSQRLENIQAIASLINAGEGLETVLDRIVYSVCKHTIWITAGIVCVDRHCNECILVARYDPYAAESDNTATRWQLDTSPTPRVVEEKRPLIIVNAQENSKYPEYQKDAIIRRYNTAVIVPLHSTDAQNRPMALSVQSRQLMNISPDDLTFLQAVAHLASIAVRAARKLDLERSSKERLQTGLAAHTELMSVVLSNSSLERAMAVIQRLLPGTLIVIDAIANVIVPGDSPAPQIIDHAPWKQFLLTKAYRLMMDLVRAPNREDAREHQLIDFRPHGLGLVCKAVVEPLNVDDQLVGAMVVISEHPLEDDLARLMANEAKFALSVQLLRSLVRFQTETNSLATLLRELFTQSYRNAEEIVARAGALGINLHEPMQLLVMDMTRSQRQEARGNINAYLHRSVVSVLRTFNRGAQAALDDDDLVVLWPSNHDDAEKLRRVAHRLGDEVRRITGRVPAICISRLCAGLGDFSQAREECAQVLGLAATVGRTGLVAQKDFGPSSLICSVAHHDRVKRYVSEMLSEIEAYDRQNGTDLLETIAMFVRCNCRYRATAQSLSIHVTTLRYRLARLAALFGLDIKDPDVRFGLELAIRIKRFLS